MTYWCCSAVVTPDHPAHRGLLINDLARSGARLVELRERLQQLRNKRYSKNFQEQRDCDLKLIADTEVKLSATEGHIAGLRFLYREVHGG